MQILCKYIQTYYYTCTDSSDHHASFPCKAKLLVEDRCSIGLLLVLCYISLCPLGQKFSQNSTAGVFVTYWFAAPAEVLGMLFAALGRDQCRASGRAVELPPAGRECRAASPSFPVLLSTYCRSLENFVLCATKYGKLRVI